MNICYVAPDVAVPYYRGSSTHVYEVSKHLSALGHRVSVVSRRLRRSQPRWETIDGFVTYRTFQGLAFEPPTSSYSAAHVDTESATYVRRLYSWYLWSYRAFQLGAEMAAVMSGRGIDVVIERETAFGAGAVMSVLLRVPMVLEMIGPRVSPVSLRRADKVLAYSTVMAGGRVPGEKLEIVPAGVDTDIFRPNPNAGTRVRKSLGMWDGAVIGYVGTFQQWHGVNDLLKAVQYLNSGTKVLEVLLVGPYFSEAMKLSESLGLAESVHFTGPVPYSSVPDYINACDVLCAPYNPALSELRSKGGIGAPLKVLEYMACEKPVITTRVPPIPEAVEDGSTGFLIRPGDVDALGGGIRALVEDPRRARAMGKEGRMAVASRYSWNALAQTIERTLVSVRDRPPENRGF
jgi:glycosyltransferase involved in cell wall biosynthesis